MSPSRKCLNSLGFVVQIRVRGRGASWRRVFAWFSLNHHVGEERSAAAQEGPVGFGEVC